jgi:Zn-dependent protease
MEDWELEFAPVNADRREGDPAELPPPDAPPRNPADDPILAEIDRLQHKKTNWLMALVTLVVSAGLFYGIGAAAWSWKLAALLIPILLFHELGHYLAMLTFRYRNVRMFFIPLFGAAVTGRNYNVAAWKKAVVSLMGPLPGIAVGTALGIAAIVLKQKLLLEAATWTVFINGLNLLPILPFDGGWNLHAILFSRHLLLDAGFRVATALVLIGGGACSREHFLTYLGIAMLVAIPTAYRVAKIAARLRREGLVARSPDSQTIPEDAARRIIDEIRVDFPSRLSNTNFARLTLQIFESLNSRPAGWFATLLLGGAHLVGLVVAIVVASLFFFASRADLNQLVREAADMPTNVYTCGTTLEASGARAPLSTGPRITLIGNFADAEKAKAAYDALLTHPLPPDISATLFGQSVLVTFPDDQMLRKEWEEKLSGVCPDYRVEDRRSLARWTVVCIAPNEGEAAALEQEMRDYLTNPSTLIPPWSTGPALTPLQQKARATYAKIQAAQQRLTTDHSAEMKEALSEVSKGKGGWDKFQEQVSRWHRETMTKALAEIRSEGEPDVDLPTTRLYETWTLPAENQKRNPDEERKIFNQLLDRMGTLPQRDGKIAPGADHRSARFGTVTRTGQWLRFDSLAFTRCGEGLPALAEWLCSRKCIAIKYRLRPLPPKQPPQLAPPLEDFEDDD